MINKLVLSVIIHLADISNPTKPWRLWYKWIDLLFLEFFKQGDKERERNLPISFLMDRVTTNIAKAQGGFIDHFVKPAYQLLEFIMPNISLNIKFLESNKEQWKLLEESYSVQNDPNVNFREEEDIMDESEFDVSESSSSMNIIQKDLHWRKQSIMIAQKRGTISRASGVKANGIPGLEALGKLPNFGFLRGISLSSSKQSSMLE